MCNFAPPPPPLPPLGQIVAVQNRSPKLSSYTQFHPLVNERRCTASHVEKSQFDCAVDAWRKHRTPYGYPGRRLYWLAAQETKTLDDFNNMTSAQRSFLINEIWKDVVICKPTDERRDAMVDPAKNAFPGFLSGLATPFQKYGYCFRCDTRKPEDVRIHGFKPAFKINPPYQIRNTYPCNVVAEDQVGLWADNRDAVSEMAICVSRGLRGCTKFPNPEYEGEAYIFAIKMPAGQMGFDTEAWQAIEVGGLWQPGEKAFSFIDAKCILGSVKIYKKHAVTAKELHRFVVHAPKWTFTDYATPEDQKILANELTLHFHKGLDQAINRADDFAVDS